MNTIRPNLPIATPRPQRPETRAAQQAFFQAATASRAASTASSGPVRPVSAPAGVRPETLAEEPSRYLRPGSLLDIKV